MKVKVGVSSAAEVKISSAAKVKVKMS